MAPDARILSIKVGTADGGADVSQVIAAIDWVVQHAHDPGPRTSACSTSPTARTRRSRGCRSALVRRGAGLEEGIVVVAAAGNTGYQLGSGARGRRPAYDPFVIAVGGSDSDGHARPTGTTAWRPSRAARAAAAPGARTSSAPGSHTSRACACPARGSTEPPAGRDSATASSAAAAHRGGGDHLGRGRASCSQRYPELDARRVKRYLEEAVDLQLKALRKNAQGEVDLGAMLSRPAAQGPRRTSPRRRRVPAARALARPGPSRPATASSSRRARHLRQAVRLGRAWQGSRAWLTVGRRPLERQRLDRQQLGRKAGLARLGGNSWRARAGRAAPGREAAGLGNSWSGNSWSQRGNSWSGNSWSGSSWWTRPRWLGAQLGRK